MSKEVKGRFAPSPTGRMHLGNVYSALLSWLSAKSKGGSWLLRIEDLDPGRSRMDYARQIEDDLIWLGLEWDEGGVDAPGYCQSQRSDIYLEQLERLRETGLTYPCWCTRADILATQAPHESDGRIVYAGTCRPASAAVQTMASEATVLSGRTAVGRAIDGRAIDGRAIDGRAIDGRTIDGRTADGGRKPATRIMVPDRDILYIDGHYGPQRVNLARHCGDFVLRRGDGAWAYQLAVVVDDALMGVTEVVRGRDLLLSAAQQIYLYGQLGFEVPEFAHLPLLCSASGDRLCKRDRSLDMECLRRDFTPEQLIGHLAHLAGLTPDDSPCRPQDLLSLFDWNLVPTQDIILK